MRGGRGARRLERREGRGAHRKARKLQQDQFKKKVSFFFFSLYFCFFLFLSLFLRYCEQSFGWNEEKKKILTLSLRWRQIVVLCALEMTTSVLLPEHTWQGLWTQNTGTNTCLGRERENGMITWRLIPFFYAFSLSLSLSLIFLLLLFFAKIFFFLSCLSAKRKRKKCWREREKEKF